MLEKVEVADQTDDGWNLVTYKRTTRDKEVGIETTNSNLSKQTREANRFTMLNLFDNKEENMTSTFKESIHEREGKDVREAMRERIGDRDYGSRSIG